MSVVVIDNKGCVDDFPDLPLAGNTLGDYYLVKNTGKQYHWAIVLATGERSDWQPVNFVDDSRHFQMAVLGRFQGLGSLPATDLGIGIVDKEDRLFNFRARRGVAGVSGTTTIQLELNGAAVAGAALSWTSADADFAIKYIDVDVSISAGDRISFRMTSRETRGQDIYAEVD